MAVSSFNITDSSVQKLFKTKYSGESKEYFNNANAVKGRIKVTENNVGKEHTRSAALGFQGGASFGSLAIANRGEYAAPTFTTKNIYTVCEVDRRTIKTSKNEGAFVDALKESVKKTVQKFNWLISFGIFHEGSGALGTIDSGGVSGTGPFTCVISAATWKTANWTIRELVSVGASSTDLFEITSVTPSTRTVVLTAYSGSYTPVAANVVYLQQSRSNAIVSLRQVLDAISSTLYGVNVAYPWQATQIGAGGAGLGTDLMNQAVLDVDAKFGEMPSLGIVGHVQMRKLMNQLEDQKRYVAPAKVQSRYGDFSWSGVQLLTANGPIPIVLERFMEDDRMYLVNEDEIELALAPDMGWADDEGFVFLRKSGGDAYEARYAAYGELYAPPTPHAKIDGLAT